MDFNNLNTESYASFILALIFSIISFATMIYYSRNKTTSTWVTVMITIILPFLSIFCWVYLLFSLFAYDVAISLLCSLACGAGYVIIALLISWLVTFISKKQKEKAEKEPKQTASKNERLLLTGNKDEAVVVDAKSEIEAIDAEIAELDAKTEAKQNEEEVEEENDSSEEAEDADEAETEESEIAEEPEEVEEESEAEVEIVEAAETEETENADASLETEDIEETDSSTNLSVETEESEDKKDD